MMKTNLQKPPNSSRSMTPFSLTSKSDANFSQCSLSTAHAKPALISTKMG